MAASTVVLTVCITERERNFTSFPARGSLLQMLNSCILDIQQLHLTFPVRYAGLFSSLHNVNSLHTRQVLLDDTSFGALSP